MHTGWSLFKRNLLPGRVVLGSGQGVIRGRQIELMWFGRKMERREVIGKMRTRNSERD